jgi:hypothetical protein
LQTVDKTAWIMERIIVHALSSSDETAVMQVACMAGWTAATYVQPMHDMSLAQSDPPPPSPLEDPPLDPLEEPLLDPLEEPLLDPLDPPLLEEPLLDPLDPPLLEEPLLDPLDPPLLEEPLLDPLLLDADASSPDPPKGAPVVFDEQATSKPSTAPDAHTNLLIFSICVSSTRLVPDDPTPAL